MQRQIDDILKKKGVAPPGIFPEQFVQDVFSRFTRLLPGAIEQTIERAANEVFKEEVERVGRARRCKFFHSRKCRKGLNINSCFTSCDQYVAGGVPWLGRLRANKIYILEAALIACAVSAAVISILNPKPLPYAFPIWLGVLILSRLHIIQQWRLIQKLRGRFQSFKVRREANDDSKS